MLLLYAPFGPLRECVDVIRAEAGIQASRLFRIPAVSPG